LDSFHEDILNLKKRILAFGVAESLLLDVFRIQSEHCKVYSDYIHYLGMDRSKVNSAADIPYLPISAFKHHMVKTGSWMPAATFTSSSTTGVVPGKHCVRDLEWYKEVSRKGFESFYGSVTEYTFFGLLPSYLERSGSSLVYMVDHFIKASGNQGGFFLYNHDELKKQLMDVQGKKILIGVSYALLDFLDLTGGINEGLIVMETGGMKGRKVELTREDLHHRLSHGFNLSSIHSEYGMTELLSQAYSAGDGVFKSSPTMIVASVQLNDPLTLESYGKTGILRIADLGNIDTCSFIQTEDLGIVHKDGSFEVLGRADHSEIRGCNLMVADLG
jgi:hypothetical protein